MSVVQKNVLVSIDEYLEAEKHAQVRHEYVRGQVCAMVGSSRAHNKLALALASECRTHLRESGCDVFVSDMKVRISDIFYYPDVVVTCSKTDANAYFSTEPILVIEVLSPSTEATDRMDKRLAYQSLSSLKEYVLVSQDQRKVELYRRNDAGWDRETFAGRDIVRFRSLEMELSIDDIYGDIAR